MAPNYSNPVDGNGYTARWQLMVSATAVLLAVAGGFLTLLDEHQHAEQYDYQPPRQ